MDKGTIFKQPIAKLSLFVTVISLASYYTRGVLDTELQLSPGANKAILVGVGGVSIIGFIVTLVALPRASGRRKPIFFGLLAVDLLIATVSLSFASFIGSIG